MISVTSLRTRTRSEKGGQYSLNILRLSNLDFQGKNRSVSNCDEH
jgi:hypothetical protein